MHLGCIWETLRMHGMDLETFQSYNLPYFLQVSFSFKPQTLSVDGKVKLKMKQDVILEEEDEEWDPDDDDEDSSDDYTYTSDDSD